MEYCILDLSSLRYQRNRTHTRLTVYSALREVLAVLDTPADLDDREVSFLGCEAVLDRARLVRSATGTGRQRLRVALYNPYSAEVSVNAVPQTTAYSDEAPLVLPPQGLTAALTQENGVDVLRLGLRRLLPVEATFASLTRTYSSHRG